MVRQLAEAGPALRPADLWKLKAEVSGRYGLERVPKNSELLEAAEPPARAGLEPLLRRKDVRTRSGVAVVTVITRPFDCPHGTCTYCPGGVRQGTPQSYTRDSPAARFGMAAGYDPARQTREALAALRRNGHDTSKVELIVLGGTVLAMPPDYQRDFLTKCYEELNGRRASSLEAAIRENERAARRCVGLTVETKPDWCREEHVDLLLSYGCTRVEIGVQSLREDVLKLVNRGHTLQDTARAFQVARDSCFKTVAHMMPRLPGSTPEGDLEDLMTLVGDERYSPDMLKVYPTLVVEGTALHRQRLRGLYRPYDADALTELLCRFKAAAPPWLRITRIQREIPDHEIAEGKGGGNLRQLVRRRMERAGLRCRCIRCREAGHAPGPLRPERAGLKRVEYRASGGTEVFLSFEDGDALFGFLRLRMPSGKEHREEIRGRRASLVRELHVFGPVVPVGAAPGGPGRAQHRGFGSGLLLEAERVSSEEFGMKKQVVIAASGTREYYRKRGYRDDGPYVSKPL